MAWTLVAALCIVAFVIVAQFSKTFRIFQKRAFVYPSGADIDQILPPEIIETILTNTDMNTLYACSLVSKYWKHHVDKDHVFTEVLEKEKAPRVTLAELAEDLKEPNLQVNWLTYHEDHYKPIWHIQDGRYIKSAGKKLIDAQYSSVSKIAKVIRDKAKKYIVRSRLRYSFESSGTYYFYIPESNEFITFYSHVLPAHVKQNLRYGAELEIVEELNHLWGKSNIQLENPASARMIERRTFLGGVPIDGSIFAMMILIFMPCVIKDFWSASADTKYYVNVLFASIGLIGAFIASVLTSYDGVRINQGATRSRARLCFGLGVAGIILLSGNFYQYAIEFGFYCGIEAGLVLYGLLLRIMHDDKHPNERHIFIISFCLLVSIIDWKLTVDAVKTGAFWYSLLYNLALHILIWLWTTFINVCYSILLSGKFDRNALSVDKQIRIVFSWAVVGILFVACAAPNTLRKVIL